MFFLVPVLCGGKRGEGRRGRGGGGGGVGFDLLLVGSGRWAAFLLSGSFGAVGAVRAGFAGRREEPSFEHHLRLIVLVRRVARLSVALEVW